MKRKMAFLVILIFCITLIGFTGCGKKDKRNPKVDQDVGEIYPQFAVEPVEDSRIIWISEDGKDNISRAGNEEEPYKTIQFGIMVAKPGDTIMVKPGTYRESDITFNGGEEGKWLTIKSEKLHGAVIDGKGLGETIKILGGKYIIIDGFEVTNSGSNMIHVSEEAHHVILRNLYAHHAGSGGDVIKLNQANNILVEGCDISYAGMRTEQGENSYQELVDLVDVDDSVIRGNFLHDTGNMAVYAKGGSRNAILEKNIICNQFEDIDPIVGIGAWTDSNLFVNGDEYESYDMIIRDNIIFNAKGGGIGVYDSIGGKIYNNTIVNVNTAVIFARSGNAPKKEVRDLEVFDNIFLDTRGEMPTVFMRQEVRQVYAFKHENNILWNGENEVPRICLNEWQVMIADPLEEGSGSKAEDPKLSNPNVSEEEAREGTYKSLKEMFSPVSK